MLYSRAAEYAIRAFVHMAQAPAGTFMMAKKIAEETQVPAHFLSKILQQLARDGLVWSNKGPRGGFRLHKAPDQISLFEIVSAIDGTLDYHRCPAGMAECNDSMPCGMHESWKALRSRILEYLEKTSIAELAEAMRQKRANVQAAASEGSGGSASVAL